MNDEILTLKQKVELMLVVIQSRIDFAVENDEKFGEVSAYYAGELNAWKKAAEYVANILSSENEGT